jgi:S1-C subfamily serine protease
VNPPKLIATFLLLFPLTALPASPQSASEIGQAVAEDALAMVQDQLEAAQAQASEAAEKAEKSLGKGIEEARKKASQQMEAARKQMEEARRQWQKQIEEARKQMQEAANSIRAAAREERLASVYPRLGIVVRPNAGDGASASAGAVVQGVTPGSPAEKAGIKAGDVITAVDGHLVQTPVDAPKGDDATSHIVRLLRKTRAGQQIEVEYRRGSENRKAEIKVESRRGSWSNPFHDDRRSIRSAELPGGWSEVELAAISSDLGEYFGTSRGLLVLHSSGEVKLKPGDVILKIGDEEPSTPTQAVRLLRSYEPGQAIPVEVLRQKQKQVLSLQMPRAGVEKH